MGRWKDPDAIRRYVLRVNLTAAWRWLRARLERPRMGVHRHSAGGWRGVPSELTKAKGNGKSSEAYVHIRGYSDEDTYDDA